MKFYCPVCGEEVTSIEFRELNCETWWNEVWVHMPNEKVNFEDSNEMFYLAYERNIWKVHHKELEEVAFCSLNDVMAFEDKNVEPPVKIEVCEI